jgi:S-adenosylmethionine hydrolase
MMWRRINPEIGNMSSLVTLTTDFGQREPFVAEIKGILYSSCPGIQVVDLGHEIARGDVMEASLFMLRAIGRFPEGTIHLVNVAPGPDPVVISVLGQQVVCPDNGLLTLLSHHHPIEGFHVIDMPDELRNQPGQIYFGREVFAPAVARLVQGEQAAALGAPGGSLRELAVNRPQRAGDGRIAGQVIHCDRFGNLVTNIHQSDLEGLNVQRVEAGGFPLGPLRYSYAEVEPGKPLALMGGSGYLEVAYHGDRADKRLDFGPGIKVHVTLEP